MQIILAQLKSRIGDFAYNIAELELLLANNDVADKLIVLPELYLTGYLIQDLAFNSDFIAAAQAALQEVVVLTQKYGANLLLGTIVPVAAVPVHNVLSEQMPCCYNAAVLIKKGRIAKMIYKHALPNYKVFDEKRIFRSHRLADNTFEFGGRIVGVVICEDLWTSEAVKNVVRQGADVIISINASPFYHAKHSAREKVVRQHVNAHKIDFVYLNMVGGQDNIVFDGTSFIMNKNGEISHILPSFASAVAAIDLESIAPLSVRHHCDFESDAYHAIVMATRDYFKIIGVDKLIIGLSGGMDSALTAVIACDCFGAENVILCSMPTRYTSAGSFADADYIVKRLGCKQYEISIEQMRSAYNTLLEPAFAGYKEDVTEENIQARIRNTILMALANKYSGMVLSTSNKSELAVGYSTIYGDMSGGYAPIADIYKTEVYKLARWRNANIPSGSALQKMDLLPESVFKKAPSAELRDNQKDQDTLPPYDELDSLLYDYIEMHLPLSELLKNREPKTVRRILNMVRVAEFKRYQAPMGPRVSKMQFQTDRRIAITNGFTVEKEKNILQVEV